MLFWLCLILSVLAALHWSTPYISFPPNNLILLITGTCKMYRTHYHSIFQHRSHSITYPRFLLSSVLKHRFFAALKREILPTSTRLTVYPWYKSVPITCPTCPTWNFNARFARLARLDVLTKLTNFIDGKRIFQFDDYSTLLPPGSVNCCHDQCGAVHGGGG